MPWAVLVIVGAVILYAWASGGSDMGQSVIEKIAAAIQSFEGYFPGSVSFRNNNPGNLKFANQPGATGQDARGFAIFDNFDDGQEALLTLLNKRAAQHPEWTLLDLFNSYAPPTDNNNPAQYADFVATRTGLTSDTTLSEIAG
jgi:hypothetical protein